MIKLSNRKLIELSDWDNLVKETYGKIYCLQQQDGCKDRGLEYLTIPYKSTDEQEMNDYIPEIINGDKMGVKFDIWLKRDPKEPLNPSKSELEECNYYWEGDNEVEWKQDKSHIKLFWERNFYPNLQTVANDLYDKGLIEAGNYAINIDW